MRRLFLASAMALAVLAVPSTATAGCIKPRKIEFAHGVSPTGETWMADASVKKNSNCHEWLFGIDYKFSGGWGWGSGTGIQVGEHTSPHDTIDGYAGVISAEPPASAAAAESTVFGYTGSEVSTIKLVTDDGTKLELHPVLPPKALRNKIVWMRGFRYFVGGYSGDGYVAKLWLFNRAGILLYRNLHAEGELR